MMRQEIHFRAFSPQTLNSYFIVNGGMESLAPVVIIIKVIFGKVWDEKGNLLA